MDEYGASTYGDRIAEIYDELAAVFPGDTERAVEALAPLAGNGPVLELGIGTGRVAIPLAARGVEVHGIDASGAMLAKLRDKQGAEAISVFEGDFADVGAGGPYSLVFVVFNTFFALLTQDDQVRCFANVASRLAPGGVFVIQAFVPDLSLYDRSGSRVAATAVGTDRARLDVSTLDRAAQRVSAQLVLMAEPGLRLYPVQLRYAYPAELDLMARLAGLRLRDRWGGWAGEPFGAESPRHVSVYEKPER